MEYEQKGIVLRWESPACSSDSATEMVIKGLISFLVRMGAKNVRMEEIPVDKP